MTPRRALPSCIAALCAAVSLGAGAAPAAGQAPFGCDPGALDPVPDEVVIGYTTDKLPADVRELPLLRGAIVDDRPPYYARIKGVARAQVIEALELRRDVRFAEPNSRLCVSALPDDELMGQMWSVQNATHGAGLPAAWDRGTAGAVTVAVLDTGIERGHPDLRDNVWSNPADPPGGGDQDGNGIEDDTHGANMINRTNAIADDQGHGTFVAGLIGARGNNTIGIAGVAWEPRLMAVKTMDSAGQGVSTDTADGIRYAVDKGARILNLSVNGDVADTAQREAIDYAAARGALIVASAGNEGRDIDATPSYPASWSTPSVIGVAASRPAGDLASFSNRGRGAVELAAPGETVISTTRGGQYGLGSGTSFAAPHVAGALALLAGARPDLGASGLREALLGGARAPGGLGVGVGRLDVGAAMARVVPGTPGTGGTGPVGGSTGTGTPAGDSGGGGTGSTVSSGKLVIRMAKASRRVRAGRRTLRWSVTGAGVTRIRSLLVHVGGRKAATGRVSATGARLRVSVKLPLRKGSRAVRLTLRDAAGGRLGASTTRVRVLAARR